MDGPHPHHVEFITSAQRRAVRHTEKLRRQENHRRPAKDAAGKRKHRRQISSASRRRNRRTS
jgi:hypothetical protein